MLFLGVLVWVSAMGFLAWKHFNPTFEISHKLCLIWVGFAIPQIITIMIDVWILFKKEYSDEGFDTDALSNRLYIALVYGIIPALAIFTSVSLLLLFMVVLCVNLIKLAEKMLEKMRDMFSTFKKFKEQNPELIEKIKIEQDQKRLSKKFKKASIQFKTNSRL